MSSATTAKRVKQAPIRRLPIERQFLLLLLSCLPFLALHFYHLWRRPHYQFFPLFLVGWFMLVWTRWPAAEKEPRREITSSKFLLYAGGLTMFVATLILSPMMTAIASILLSGSILLPVARAYPEQRLGRCWLLLWLLIPPPFSLDLRLIQWLQRSAATASSRLLDMLGYRHLLEGTIIELPGHQLFVEEACSGVQSLFALMIFTLLYGVWQNRTLLQIVPLTLAAAFWSTVGNIIRLLTISVALADFDIDLTAGWEHEAIGYVVFGLAFWMVVSTDRLLCFLFDPIQPKGSKPSAWSKTWNRWISGIRSDDSTEVSQTPRLQPPDQAGSTPKSILIAMLVFGGLQLAMFGQGLVIRYKTFTLAKQLDSIDDETFPETMGAWKKQAFEFQERDRNSEEGRYSKLWQFVGPGYSVFVSMDYPFVDSHDLTSCYVHKGWKVDQSAVVEDKLALKSLEVDLNGQLGKQGFLLFSLFDEAGDAVEPPSGIKAQLRGLLYRVQNLRLLHFLGAAGGPSPVDSNVYQLQAFAVSEFELTDAQKQQIREQFADAQQIILERWNREGDDE